MDPTYPITHWTRPIYRELLLQNGFADDKNCVCGDIQTTSTNHILKHCTVLTPPCSGTNTTSDEDLMEYLILLFRSNRILLVSFASTKETMHCVCTIWYVVYFYENFYRFVGNIFKLKLNV